MEVACSFLADRLCQARPYYRDNHRTELWAELRADHRAEARTELWAELRAELRIELRAEWRAELRVNSPHPERTNKQYSTHRTSQMDQEQSQQKPVSLQSSAHSRATYR